MLRARPSLLGPARLSAAQRAARYGLVAAWNLDEASGNRADSFGVSTLVDQNTVTSGTGPDGRTCGQFTAANSEFLSLADNAATSGGDVGLWIAGHFNLDDTAGSRVVVGKWGNGVNNEYFVRWTAADSKLTLHVSSDGGDVNATSVGVSAPGASTWHFFMAYHDPTGDVIGLRADAGAWGTAAWSLGVNNGGNDFFVGAKGAAGDGFMNGRIALLAMGKVATIGSLRDEIYTYLRNGGVGRRYPAAWT